MELAESRLLLTSLTDIGVRGVNVLPTKNKITKLKKRTTKQNRRENKIKSNNSTQQKTKQTK